MEFCRKFGSLKTIKGFFEGGKIWKVILANTLTSL